MRNFIKKQFLLSLLLSFCTAIAVGQQKRTVTGVVRDDAGQTIPGAVYQVKGSNVGGATNVDGQYSVSVEDNAVLVFSFMGYKSKEVPVGTQTTVNVTLESDNKALNEVVVTALGIRRERKSLGYAVQEVKGETLAATHEPNVTNALSGRVAGLQVIRSSTGPAGSSKITLRGNNSLTGSNQPLIVVDGVPIDNFTGAANNDFYNPSQDLGNGLADINAEDIESMSVLKGGAAAALYGSRAGNGVILITTKTGRAQKGLGITVTSSLGIESIFMKPKFQNEFGQGDNNVYDDRSRTSWGPKITGQTVKNWDGSQVPLTAYDNLGNYLDKGIQNNQSISLQQQYKSSSIYTSYNRLNSTSIMPGVKYTRNNLVARAVSKFGKNDRWTTDTKFQFSNANAVNRPIGGNRSDNPFNMVYLMPRSLDIRQFSNAVDANKNMFWYGDPGPINPYWTSRYNTNQDIRDRYVLNGSLKYEFTPWLSIEGRAGADMYTTNSEAKLYGGSPIAMNGRYSTGKQTFQETNYSTLLTARKDNLFGKLGGSATLGGNLMSQNSSYLFVSSGELNARDLFSLNNGKNNPTVDDERRLRKKINSIYGSVGANWDGYLFLDATFRNDWTSTLSSANRSFFYPSISASYVFTDMFEKMDKPLPTWISFGKLRASYAQVGNDLPPYQLYNTYNIGKDPNGNTTAGRNGTLYDPNVVNELIKTLEIGAEMRFFNGRFGFDFAYYKNNATNQLIDLPMDPLSGYSSRKINAGDIQNEGIEATVDARIFQSQRSFNWNLSVNLTRNVNTINAITNDVREYPLPGGGFDAVRIVAATGQKYGEIYGNKFLRVKDAGSPYVGQLILDANGLPQSDPVAVSLGNQQPSALVGITNSFRYRGLNFSFLVDGRFGGKIFSTTNALMQRAGTAAVTVVNGERANMLVDGVVFNSATNTYSKNTKAVAPQQYWTAAVGGGNIGIPEANMYDATNIRVRNVQLSYDLPSKLLSKTPLQRANIGVSCNNVWMLKSHLNGIDPESVYATGTNAVGFENSSAPTTRLFLFNLTLGF
jgi:TonB-linked SusC/RagA family outer membrane protein